MKEQLLIRLPVEMKKALREEASKSGSSMCGLISMILKQYLEAQRKK